MSLLVKNKNCCSVYFCKVYKICLSINSWLILITTFNTRQIEILRSPASNRGSIVTRWKLNERSSIDHEPNIDRGSRVVDKHRRAKEIDSSQCEPGFVSHEPISIHVSKMTRLVEKSISFIHAMVFVLSVYAIGIQGVLESMNVILPANLVSIFPPWKY